MNLKRYIFYISKPPNFSTLFSYQIKCSQFWYKSFAVMLVLSRIFLIVLFRIFMLVLSRIFIPNIYASLIPNIYVSLSQIFIPNLYPKSSSWFYHKGLSESMNGIMTLHVNSIVWIVPLRPQLGTIYDRLRLSVSLGTN